MINANYKYSDLTERIIGCALKVHNHLGNGFQEVIYQRALAIEFEEARLNFAREDEMLIKYKGHDIGTRRVDFFVENKILVEIKAVTNLENVHLAQSINYLEAFDKEVGLLINFGSASMEFRRLENKKIMPVI
jgi:GxxExxY protein